MRRWLPFVKTPPLVAVLRLEGSIGTGPRAISDQAMAPLIERAFRRGKPAAVALQINSPGGSPVQSSLIASRIRRLAEETETPVFAFVEDLAASGGYWLAAAADEIHVDRASILGSIGVIAATFGFPGAMEKIGVERRVHTAGKAKSFLDPFRPEKPEDVARLTELLDGMHEVFKSHVTDRRAGKLPQGEDLFTGEVWIGQGAIDKGLADGIGHLVPTMKARFGDKVAFRRYAPRRPLLARFGARIVDDALDGLEERAARARFGL